MKEGSSLISVRGKKEVFLYIRLVNEGNVDNWVFFILFRNIIQGQNT